MSDNGPLGDGHGAPALDRDSPLPLYYQLKQTLLGMIHNGDLAPGEPLPSEKELEETYGVSRITVRRALGDLAAEGYLSRQVGRGTFVQQVKLQDRSERLGGFLEHLTGQGLEIESRILQVGRAPAPPHVPGKLNVEEGHPLFVFQRYVLADNEPFALTTAYFNVPEHVVLSEAELKTNSVFPLLEHKYNIVLPRGDKTVEATGARPHESTLLNVDPDAPLLLTELIVYDTQDQPLGFVQTLYRGDRYKYFTTVTR